VGNGGDLLARGARSAVFPPPKVTQERWDAIWASDEPEVKTPTADFPLPEVTPLAEMVKVLSGAKAKKNVRASVSKSKRDLSED
jgi:hypothetical protein